VKEESFKIYILNWIPSLAQSIKG